MSQCHEEGPLNWKEIWTKTIDDASTCEIAESLFKELLLIVQTVLTAKTTSPAQVINALKTLKYSRAFNTWERSVAILQKVFAFHTASHD